MGLLYALLLLVVAAFLGAGLLVVVGSIYFDATNSEIPLGVEQPAKLRILHAFMIGTAVVFIRDPENTFQTTHGRDYVRFPTEVPDRTVMRKNMKKLDGLPKKHVLTHHNEAKHHYLVTQYDSSFNRHDFNPLLPPLRKWSRHKVAWIPEKLDFPAVEPPTNYGLFEHLMKKWRDQDAATMNSVYTISYVKPPISAYPVHQHPITSFHLPSSLEHLQPRTIDAYL